MAVSSFDRFQRTALLTTATTYLLIAVGGLVRASGAGLGCPDWPQCFGLWIPPVTAADLPPAFDPAEFNFFKTWTEYINRLLGALTGLLILATLVFAFIDHRDKPRVLGASFAAFVFVLFNAWLGGVVVKSKLAPLVLTGHLVFALVVVGFLLFATASVFLEQASDQRPPTSAEARLVSRTSMVVAALVLAQIGFGALVRGEVQRLAEAGMERGEWLAHAGSVASIHQSLAPLIAGAVLVVVALALRSSDPALRWVAFASGALVLIQGLAGVGLRAWAFPRVLQVVHLWAAALLLGALMLQSMVAWVRFDQRPSLGASAP